MREKIALGLTLALVLSLSSCKPAAADPTPSAPLSTFVSTPSASAPTPSGAGGFEPTSTPDPTPDPTPEPTPSEPPDAHGAGLYAGLDYDFSQPVPEADPVEEDYFSDAAFVGDSRTQGFMLYSGIKQGTFIAYTGLSVFNIWKQHIDFDGRELTALEALGEGSYGKVYLSLGVNELGMYNNRGYADNFARLIDEVRALQPEATVYVQLIIPVNTQKCGEKKQPYYVTNEKIDVYNELLRELVQEKHVFLVDPAAAIVDETGETPYDLTGDGVHFRKAGYQLWYDYLTRHTVYRGEWTGEEAPDPSKPDAVPDGTSDPAPSAGS